MAILSIIEKSGLRGYLVKKITMLSVPRYEILIVVPSFILIALLKMCDDGRQPITIGPMITILVYTIYVLAFIGFGTSAYYIIRFLKSIYLGFENFVIKKAKERISNEILEENYSLKEYNDKLLRKNHVLKKELDEMKLLVSQDYRTNLVKVLSK